MKGATGHATCAGGGEEQHMELCARCVEIGVTRTLAASTSRNMEAGFGAAAEDSRAGPAPSATAAD